MLLLKHVNKFAFFILINFLALTSFARIGENDKTGTKKDSAAAKQEESASEYGFKNLFNNGFNPTQPYITQLNPQAIPFVEDYIKKQGKELESMRGWADPYFRMMEGILESYGIPKEMKYLAVIESHLKPRLVSWAGAVGPWQFMPETGRRMGLTINRRYDERTNYYKSTYAAAKYLKELYSQLGDWLLVIAAYNGGPARVFNAIRKSGSSNFWDLQEYLPLESRNHVKKFIGTHYVFEGCGGMTTSTAEEWNKIQMNMLNQATQLQGSLSKEELAGTKELNVTGKYNSIIIAKNLGVDIAQFNRLNPRFDELVDSKNGYNLRLPKEKVDLFEANKYIILKECVLTALQYPVNSTISFPNENRFNKTLRIRKK